MRPLLILLCLLPIMTRAEISVVTSIRPLYQITAAIMQETGNEPTLLIKHQHDIHDFAFKPSHFRVLQRANLVIWIDRHFESGFQRLPEILSPQTHALELLPALSLQTQDGHIWYSPNLLIKVSHLITNKLKEIDADNHQLYDQNRQAFQRAIQHWQHSIKQLHADRQPRYLLDHDFLHHFEQAFNLQAVAVIHDRHHQHGGIKSLQTIERQLQNQPANCLISNKAHISGIGKNLADKFMLSQYHIKPFVNAGDPATRLIRHLQHLADILRHC